MLPETLPSRILVHKARRLRHSFTSPELSTLPAPAEVSDKTLGSLYRTALLRPWRILRDSICIACRIYTALIYALLYMLFTIYPIVFHQMCGWNAGVSELPLLAIALWSIIGGFCMLCQTKRDLRRVPEDRMPLAMIGSIIFPISMFWFSWTAQYTSIHWIVPTLAGGMLAISFLLISVAYLNYIADCYTSFAASALAANSICRSLCGAATPLFKGYMYNALGVAGGGSLIAGLGCVLVPIPFVFYRYGARIRSRSRFAKSMEDDAIR